ncbi:MAG: NAD-dependent epimerase/dehydratase family protein [Pseudomonadota bacterium]
MSKTILLTGITGFIAKCIARDLLAAGYSVRGSLRSAARESEVRAAMGDVPLDKLSFVSLDLNVDAGWADAMAGVDAVFHTASPFPMDNPASDDELVKPAVDGTLRALRAAQKAQVTRVILTSSVVAIMHADRPNGYDFGPDDWTDPDHPTARAYVKSKTLAERAAWDFIAEHPEMELTTVNPGLVCGTPLDSHYGTSLRVIERIFKGKDPAMPDIGFPVVDIADVSRVHIGAFETPSTIGMRLVAASDYWRMPEIAALLSQEYPDRKISTRTAPKLLLRLLALFDPTVKAVLPSVGLHSRMDNSATEASLNMRFIPGRDALLASAAALSALGSH